MRMTQKKLLQQYTKSTQYFDFLISYRVKEFLGLSYQVSALLGMISEFFNFVSMISNPFLQFLNFPCLDFFS